MNLIVSPTSRLVRTVKKTGDGIALVRQARRLPPARGVAIAAWRDGLGVARMVLWRNRRIVWLGTVQEPEQIQRFKAKLFEVL